MTQEFVSNGFLRPPSSRCILRALVKYRQRRGSRCAGQLSGITIENLGLPARKSSNGLRRVE